MESENIEVFDYPIQINLGTWAIEHPDCDCIHEMIGTGPLILVYAFAKNPVGNTELKRYRDRHFADKRILKGMTADGIRGIV